MWTAPKINALLLKVPAPKASKMPMPSMRGPNVSARTVANVTRGTSAYPRIK